MRDVEESNEHFIYLKKKIASKLNKNIALASGTDKF